MSFFRKSGPTKAAVGIIVLLCLVWTVAARLLLWTPFSASFSFLAYQLLFVALPGMALHKLTKVSTAPLGTLVVSYGLGILSNVAVYFLFIPFGLGEYILFGLIALCAAAVAVLVLRRKQPLSGEADRGELSVALVFGAVAAVISFMLLSMAYLNPAISGTRVYYHDTFYGVDLVIAASRSFPMQSMVMAGLEQAYHIFFYSYAACMYLVLGVPAFEVTTQLTMLTIAPFAVASFAALLASFCKDRRVLWLGTGIFTLIPALSFTHSVYIDTLGFPLSIAYCMLAPLFFFKAQQQSRGINRLHILATIFLIGALGAKGPLAVSVLFGICFVLLIELIETKNTLVFPKGLLYAVSFFLFFMLLYAGGKSVGDSMSISPFYSAIRTDFAYAIEGKLPYVLYLILCGLWYTISFSPTVVLCIAVAVVGLRRVNGGKALLWFSVGSGIESLVMINLLKQGGSSELYFVMGIYPILFAIALAASAHLVKNKSVGKGLCLCAALLALGCFANDAIDSLGFFSGSAEYKQRYYIGLEAAKNYSVFNRGEGVSPPAKQTASDVTPADYEAYCWLRDNTPKDSIIASYRYSVDNLYFAGSSFSERVFYLEGWNYITQQDTNHLTDEKLERNEALQFLFSSHKEGFVIMLAKEGCDYLMLDKVVSGDWELSSEHATEVFRNDATIIYQLASFE